MHVIKLNGYNATTENGEKLELGTFDSYGEEQLQIVEAPDWVNLSVIATFNPPNKKPVQVVVDSVTGVIKVPKEATADLYGVGTIVFVGLADGVQRISADCEYIVRKHSNASGTEPAEPTPDLLQQVLTLSKDAQTAAKNAEQSAKNAEQSAESAAKDAADTVKPYKEEAVRAATAAALSEKNAAESKAAAQEAAERATQAGIAASNAAEEAERSAGIATDAAGNSALNAENARKSALAAQQSANNAAESQSAAAASADAAAKSQQSAAIDAKTASDAKVAAAGSAEAAAGSANAAENSASAAARSEQAAGASEVKAAESEKAAKASEQAAAESAQAALESKTAAAISEGNAAASAKKAQDVADSLPEDYTTAVNEIATLKQQVANITPDDSAIGEKPWSSKNIVDMLCPEIKESGNPVQCYPVAEYPLGVTARWEPVQEGEGEPYPAGGGKNLWGNLTDETFIGQTGIQEGLTKAKSTAKITCTEKDVYTLSSSKNFTDAPGNIGVIAYFDNSDSVLTRTAVTYKNVVTLVAPAGTAYVRASCYAPTDDDKIQFEKGATATAWAPYENIRPIVGRDSVTVERCGENLLDIAAFSLDVDKNKRTYTATVQQLVPPGEYTIKCTRTNPESGFGMQIFMRNGKKVSTSDGRQFKIYDRLDSIYFYISNVSGNVDNIKDIMLIHGSTAPTTYTPYTGQTNTLTLPEPVYGGSVDARTGEGAKEWEIDNKSATNIRTSGDNTEFVIAAPCIAETSYNVYSNIFPRSMIHVGNYYRIRRSATGFNNIDDLRSAIGDTTVQIAYKLATPVPFTATGGAALPALDGVNTVITDADSATVTGRADPIKRITDLEDAVASQT